MSPKTLIGFTIVTIIVVVAASFSVATRYSVHKIGFEDKPVLPGFAGKVAGVEAIIVQDVKQKLTVKRDGDNWVMADRQNYKASNEVVSDLMLGLSELRLREAKTKRYFVNQLTSKRTNLILTKENIRFTIENFTEYLVVILNAIIVNKNNSRYGVA